MLRRSFSSEGNDVPRNEPNPTGLQDESSGFLKTLQEKGQEFEDTIKEFAVNLKGLKDKNSELLDTLQKGKQQFDDEIKEFTTEVEQKVQEINSNPVTK